MTVGLFKEIPLRRPRGPHDVEVEVVHEETDVTVEDEEDVVVVVGEEIQPGLKQPRPHP